LVQHQIGLTDLEYSQNHFTGRLKRMISNHTDGTILGLRTAHPPRSYFSGGIFNADFPKTVLLPTIFTPIEC